MKKAVARLADRPEDYKRLGLDPSKIFQWEDALHTNGKLGEYEWWYFDAKLEGGYSLVIIFYSQPVTAATNGFSPCVSFSLTGGGHEILEETRALPKDCFFSKKRCDVRIGKSFVRGNLRNYKIHFENERIQCDMTLEGRAVSYRHKTGQIFFGEKNYFAWLPAVPEGQVCADICVDGEQLSLSGSGYHDHNWGNVGMYWLMHHWYWGRARVGEYQVISSYITAGEKYGYEHFPIFVIYKNGQRLGCTIKAISYEQKDPAFDPITKKHYHKTLIYDYNDGKHHFRVTYRAKDIIETFVADEAYGSARASAGRALIGFVKMMKLSPSYIRMVGDITLERFEGETVAESLTENGIWEQMYFGLDKDV
ncbi:MAG: hypothetical protein E7643_06510 [Ruminococcaceae bacterium]|nr:hypothetical protein [Oscillospiraceae bacterium]